VSTLWVSRKFWGRSVSTSSYFTLGAVGGSLRFLYVVTCLSRTPVACGGKQGSRANATPRCCTHWKRESPRKRRSRYRDFSRRLYVHSRPSEWMLRRWTGNLINPPKLCCFIAVRRTEIDRDLQSKRPTQLVPNHKLTLVFVCWSLYLRKEKKSKTTSLYTSLEPDCRRLQKRRDVST